MTKITKSIGAQKPLEFSDMLYIQNYQRQLIDYFLYETTRGQEYAREKLMFEIQTCERWLKKHFTTFMNDNNRKYEA